MAARNPIQQRQADEQFHRRVSGHLRRLLELTPRFEPHDLEDPRVEQFTAELDQLETILYGLGYDERDAERREDARESCIRAKRDDPTLEDVVMRIDHRVQRTLELLGQDEFMRGLVGGLGAELLVHSVVLLLEKLPAPCFSPDGSRHPDSPSARDATVAGIIALLYERKQRPLASEERAS